MSEIKVEDRSMMGINAYAPCDGKGKINFLTELSNAVYKNMNTYMKESMLEISTLLLTIP